MTLKPEVSSELRHIVRDVLREVMAQRGQQNSGTPGVESVCISNDQELAAFVARVIEPATAERIRAGKLRFTLSVPPSGSAAVALTGVITEQKVEQLKGKGRLILAVDAVLTPLARDKARKLGLTLERRR
ncbi:hypothetical protein [Aestuariivirga sp.]|uniref:hypothetical protein n=1 Tax=Aestuariivirga sp. TaxID=2650926 RepID=UPI003BAC2D41